MDTEDLAYLAAVVDTQGIIRTRLAGDTELPVVAVHGSNVPVLEMLGESTGTGVTIVRRDYSRSGCAEHCPEQHQHIVSTSGRWSVTGAKATVLLFNVLPYLRLQNQDATAAVELGRSAPFKPASLTKMAALGWELPEEWS